MLLIHTANTLKFCGIKQKKFLKKVLYKKDYAPFNKIDALIKHGKRKLHYLLVSNNKSDLY